jgi:tetratricopeptide (TPR) repeat protein
MRGFYAILGGILLGAVLAFMINLFSNWAWDKLSNRPMSQTAARTPLQADGACEAPPHETGTGLGGSKPELNTHARDPSRCKQRGIMSKNTIIGLILMIIILIVVFLVVHTQYPMPALPSGIDYKTGNIKASWNNKGVTLYNQGNYTGAIACYDRAIGIDPGYALAWSNKGNALKALRRNAEAEKAFAKAQGEI